ncbi:hypothetical protein BDN67DRAFT_914323 [Paxillus ammoniavirescens]|nr:hypothetical protein BDN67DRAFT_914323 [Paxillus ammoniavirescens]
MVGLNSALQALNVNVEESNLEWDNPRICPACHKYFKSSQGVNAHLSTARSCHWYKSGKIKALTIPGTFDRDTEIESRTVNAEPHPHGGREEENPAEVVDDFYDRQYDFIPSEEAEGSSRANGPHMTNNKPEEDNRVFVEDEDAGRVIRVDETLHQR